MPPKIKKEYHGIFNWKGENHEFYRFAISPSQAKTLMLRALADELKVTSFFVRQYFSKDENNWEINESGRVKKL